jgi:hypothetical protein
MDEFDLTVQPFERPSNPPSSPFEKIPDFLPLAIG